MATFDAAWSTFRASEKERTFRGLRIKYVNFCSRHPVHCMYIPGPPKGCACSYSSMSRSSFCLSALSFQQQAKSSEVRGAVLS